MFSTVQFATLSVLGVALFSSLADSKENLTVVMVLSEPYLMLRNDDGHSGGTKQYEGFNQALLKLEAEADLTFLTDSRTVSAGDCSIPRTLALQAILAREECLQEMGGASLLLSLKNIAGIFLLLLICLIFIILVFGLEWLRSYRQAQDQPSTTEQ
eukprot:GFUD01085798.1.p1 GENE.GFUD01085798.1~~GFUD01085798.1.p1  ORF type:complete len:156 (-),score=26.77 GFUD01085798.1:21-488(-)